MMEFVFGLIAGICTGLIAGSLAGQEMAHKPDINQQVDDLNAQAQRNLEEFQENQHQIHQVTQKADAISRDLRSKVAGLINQG